MEWTEARIEKLTQLWKAGNSASQCARLLGETTRAAVIGKVHRLGIAERGTASLPKPSPDKPALKRNPERTEVTARQVNELKHGAAKAITSDAVVGLEQFMCRWPIGDPSVEGFRFCCQRTRQGPYCESHKASAYQHRPVQKVHALKILKG